MQRGEFTETVVKYLFTYIFICIISLQFFCDINKAIMAKIATL